MSTRGVVQGQRILKPMTVATILAIQLAVTTINTNSDTSSLFTKARYAFFSIKTARHLCTYVIDSNKQMELTYATSHHQHYLQRTLVNHRMPINSLLSIRLVFDWTICLVALPCSFLIVLTIHPQSVVLSRHWL